MVETLECDDGVLIEGHFGFVSHLKIRGTTHPLSPISESPIAQRGYKKVHWTERGLNALIKSSRSFLVMSVLSLKMNGTSVALTFSDDCDPSGQPKPLLQSSEVSLRNDQTRSGTQWMQAKWRVTVESVNKLAGVFPSQSTTLQEDGATSSTDVAEPVTDSTEVYETTKGSVSAEQEQLLRTAEPSELYCRVHTLTAGRVWKGF